MSTTTILRILAGSVPVIGGVLVAYASVYGAWGPSEQQLIEADMATALTRLRAGGSKVSIAYPATLAAIADDPAVSDSVEVVAFFMADMSDHRMQRLTELTSVSSVFFYSCHDATAVIERLHQLPELQSVGFETTRVETAALATLLSALNLKAIHFEQIMPAEVIESLQQRRPDLDIKWATQ